MCQHLVRSIRSGEEALFLANILVNEMDDAEEEEVEAFNATAIKEEEEDECIQN